MAKQMRPIGKGAFACPDVTTDRRGNGGKAAYEEYLKAY